MNGMRGTRALLLIVGVASLTMSGAGAAAQAPPPGQAQARSEQPPAGRPAQRAAIERRLQERINQIVRTRLALTDDQFVQLRGVSERIEKDRRALRRDEMLTRNELRRLLSPGESPNEARVAELLEQLPRLERRRIDMQEQEQRELARFLQPSQRARYFALQDQLRREVQEGQRRRMGGDGPPGNAPPPPRRGSRPPANRER